MMAHKVTSSRYPRHQSLIHTRSFITQSTALQASLHAVQRPTILLMKITRADDAHYAKFSTAPSPRAYKSEW